MSDQETSKYPSLAIRWIAIIAAALPALIPLWLIHRDGVNIPYMDQWGRAYAELYVKSHQGKLTFWDFTEQQNEHRMFVPKVIYYVLNYATHWNTIGEMLAEWVIVLATSINLAWLCFRVMTPVRAALLWFFCNLLIFTPVQWENWTWGLGLINVLPMWFITTAMVVAVSAWPMRIKLPIAIGLAIAANFSSGQGILAWALVLPLLVWSRSIKELLSKGWIVGAWAGGFLFSLLLYNIGYVVPGRPPELQGYYVNPVLVIRFVLAFLGNPLTHYTTWPPPIGESMIVGAVLLLLLLLATGFIAYMHFNRKDHAWCESLLAWLLIGWYAVLSAAIASEFRARQGEWMSMSSRYGTCALFLPIALVILIPAIAMRITAGRRAAIKWISLGVQLVLLTGLLVMYFISSNRGIFNADMDARGRREGKVALRFINFMPDNRWLFELVGPGAASRIPIAKELNEMGFLNPPLATSNNMLDFQDSGAQTSMGAMESVQKANDGQTYIIGWAMLPKNRPADGVVLSYEDENHKPIVFSMAKMAAMLRPDLAASHGAEWYRFCGWAAPLDLNSVPATVKQTRIGAWSVDSDTGRAYRLNGELSFQR